MKKHLGKWLRIFVSLGILLYLFNNIFFDVAEQIASDLLKAPASAVAPLARSHAVSVELAAQIRENCTLGPQDSVNLKALSWATRTRFAWTVGPHELLATFRRMSLPWFAAALAFFGGVCLVGTVRWRALLLAQGLDLSFGRVVSIFFVGHFFNAFMLGATGGDVIKAWYVARETHHRKAEAVATVIMDRIVGLLGLVVLALLAMAWFHRRVLADPKMISFALFTGAIVAGTVVVTVLAFWRGSAQQSPLLDRLLRRLPKHETLTRMLSSYRAYVAQPRLVLKTLSLSLLLHLLVIASIVCVAVGLGIYPTHGLADFLLYLPIINTISALPISISGFGVREGMYVTMLAGVGVAKAPAMALSLLGYLASLSWSVIGGFFFLTHRKELPPVSSLETADVAQ